MLTLVHGPGVKFSGNLVTASPQCCVVSILGSLLLMLGLEAAMLSMFEEKGGGCLHPVTIDGET